MLISTQCRVIWLVYCAQVMNNSLMVYYICPMHTLFTVLVYACLAIKSDWNKSNLLLAVKMLLCFALVIVFWEIKSVFFAVWGPFEWLMGYSDPRRPNPVKLHGALLLDRACWCTIRQLTVSAMMMVLGACFARCCQYNFRRWQW